MNSKSDRKKPRAYEGVFEWNVVALALDEALDEKHREPKTDVWQSFWDRLLEGDEIPDRATWWTMIHD